MKNACTANRTCTCNAMRVKMHKWLMVDYLAPNLAHKYSHQHRLQGIKYMQQQQQQQHYTYSSHTLVKMCICQCCKSPIFMCSSVWVLIAMYRWIINGQSCKVSHITQLMKWFIAIYSLTYVCHMWSNTTTNFIEIMHNRYLYIYWYRWTLQNYGWTIARKF